MASFNKVLLMGNLTRDPELRYTSEGTAVAEIGLAVNQVFVKRNTNERREDVVFVSITVWGRQAEACGEYLSKGAGLFVEGRLQLDSWEGKDGQKRSRLRVVAQRVQFLSRPKGGATAPKTTRKEEFAQQNSFGDGEPNINTSSSDNISSEEVPF